MTNLNKFKLLHSRINSLLLIVIAVMVSFNSATVFAAPPTLNISNIPLEIANSSNPQVLIAVANSESMDGTLSGSILTGSGSLGAGLNSLTLPSNLSVPPSSPVNYTVPAGFTAPSTLTTAGNAAPYTLNTSGSTWVDNSASRLNSAKAGIKSVIKSYMKNSDFALAAYSTTGGLSTYTTYVYYMSPPGGFTFFNSLSPAPVGNYVINPCFGYNNSGTTVSTAVINACNTMAGSTLFTNATAGLAALNTNQYMNINISSDDPTINDVLYLTPGQEAGVPPVFVDYGGSSPANPYVSFGLAQYNAGTITERYPTVTPNNIVTATGPTNAGYVPYTPAVMYVERGFGYIGNQVANPGSGNGNILQPMITSGSNPSAATVAAQAANFTPFLAPETNSAGSGEIKSVAVQSPMAGLLKGAYNYLTNPSNILTASVTGCAPKQYVVLVTDGLPTQDLNGKLWPPLGSAAASGYGVTATFNTSTDGSLNTTNDQALQDTIIQIAALKANGILTFVIGVGAGVQQNVNPSAFSTLNAMAVAGGTTGFFPANDQPSLVSAFNQIMISVESGHYSTTSSAFTSSILKTSSLNYTASYNPADNSLGLAKPYYDWTGNILAQPLSVTTGLPTTPTLWSAQSQLDTLISSNGPSSRVIATWDPYKSGGAGAVPFQWANISSSLQALLQPVDALGTIRLSYLRGNTSLERRNGGAFRNRSHILGDIVHSAPALVLNPNSAYYSPSYVAFQNTYVNRQSMLYAGGNDGMLHAFNTSNGNEQFAFIPNAVFKNLYNLSAIIYNQNHQYFVDGPPQSGDVKFVDGSWHTVLVGGENGGGNTIYALDITNPAILTTESSLSNKVMWEFSDVDMGLSFSVPQIAQITPASAASPSFAVFFGNGYNSPNGNAVLYAVDPQTGAQITKINLCTAIPSACNSALPQGLSTVVGANSSGLQGAPITQVYAGDLQGNLWAVDVSNLNPSLWGVRLLFKGPLDANNNPYPITTAPVAALNPQYPRVAGLLVMFGTGQLLQTSDLSSTQTQTIYGVLDKGVGTSGSGTFTRTNLVAQTLAIVSPAVSGFNVPILTDTSNVVNFATKAGWYDDLPIPGQGSFNNPILSSGSYVTTINTPTDSCTPPAFTSILLDLNYATGGAFAVPQLDINGNGIVNSADSFIQTLGGTTTISNPVGLGTGSNAGYASPVTSLHAGVGGSNGFFAFNSAGTGGNSGKSVNAVANKQNNPRHSTWKQIR